MLTGGLGGVIVGGLAGFVISGYAVNLLEYLQSDGREDDVYTAYLLFLMPILGIGGLVRGANFGVKVGSTIGEVVADTAVTGAMAVSDSTNRFFEERTRRKVKHFCDTFAESSQVKDINDENISKIITGYLVPA
jgi:hypothetical protein